MPKSCTSATGVTIFYNKAHKMQTKHYNFGLAAKMRQARFFMSPHMIKAGENIPVTTKEMTYMRVLFLGNDRRLSFCRERLLMLGADVYESILLLPIPSTADGVHVRDTDVLLSALGAPPYGCSVIVCYGIERAQRSAWADAGVCVIELSRNEEYLAANSRLTAEAVLSDILATDGKAPCHLKIGIIGYGRIGQRLASLLAFLGARIRVFTSRSELSRDLCMLGVSGVDSLSMSGEGAQDALVGLDVLINTAPARLIPHTAAGVLKNTRIIELASGENIPPGITYERLPSLPAKRFPASAGYMLADAIAEALGIRAANGGTGAIQ